MPAADDIVTGETGPESQRDAARHRFGLMHNPVTPRQLCSSIDRYLNNADGRAGAGSPDGRRDRWRDEMVSPPHPSPRPTSSPLRTDGTRAYSVSYDSADTLVMDLFGTVYRH